MRRVYFINRFFYPDFSATSQMLTDLAVGPAGDYDITFVTSRALYNDPLAELARRDEHQSGDLDEHPSRKWFQCPGISLRGPFLWLLEKHDLHRASG